MDANKLDKLIEIGYNFYGTCGDCVYGSFEQGQDFGTCKLYEYEHQKHSQATRELSVNRAGRCSCHKVSAVFIRRLGSFRQFVVGDGE